MGVAALPQHYDYYGAYAEEGSGWRLGEGHADVPAHAVNRYDELLRGELTFDWPRSFERVAYECRAAREGAAQRVAPHRANAARRGRR